MRTRGSLMIIMPSARETRHMPTRISLRLALRQWLARVETSGARAELGDEKGGAQRRKRYIHTAAKVCARFLKTMMVQCAAANLSVPGDKTRRAQS
jgi:hypothetical protein